MGLRPLGPRALQMIDNVSPYIPGEEDKLENELSKILAQCVGEFQKGSQLYRDPSAATLVGEKDSCGRGQRFCHCYWPFEPLIESTLDAIDCHFHFRSRSVNETLSRS